MTMKTRSPRRAARALALVLLAALAPVASAQTTHTLPLVPPASAAGIEGFIRIINLSDEAGTVAVHAIDDAGERAGPVTLSLGAGSTVHFRSRDLEEGNAARGLPDGIGDGTGSWRLELVTALSIRALAYIRTADGFLTSMHDTVSEEAGTHLVLFFNPASNVTKQSRLRLVNPGAAAAAVTITARDDTGAAAPGGAVTLTLAAGASQTLTAQALEAGGEGFTGSLGDGSGKWRLSVTADRPIEAMSLLRSATGHLANLSTAPAARQAPAGAFQAPEMVTVPAGSYMMGSPESEAGRRDLEGPARLVTIASPFAVGKYEVTRGEFARFVSETGREIAEVCRVYVGEDVAPSAPDWRGAAWREGRDWRNPGFVQADDHPVVCVSWFDAKAYVAWLSRKTGDRYRLLTESEWEYVARAGTTTARYWGESSEDQCLHANGADSSSGVTWRRVACDDGHARTAPVGSYGANPFGVHDMMGNVFEWVEDGWWRVFSELPVDGSAWVYGGSFSNTTRGGSWRNSDNHLRSADRRGQAAPMGSAWTGLRVARTLSPSSAQAATGQEPVAGAIASNRGLGHGGQDGPGGVGGAFE